MEPRHPSLGLGVRIVHLGTEEVGVYHTAQPSVIKDALPTNSKETPMKPRRKPRLLTAARWAPLLTAGMVLQINLGGCDDEVKDKILTGIQTSVMGLVTSVMDAFFLSISGGSSTTTQTVKAVIDTASTWLA